MNLGDILKKIQAKDHPIFTVPEHDTLVDILKQVDDSITFDRLSKATGITKERLLEINQEISLHFKDKLAGQVLYKSMLSERENPEEFEQFFQRQDVEISCLFMSKISDVFEGMTMKGTSTWDFLMDNWRKYRGY